MTHTSDQDREREDDVLLLTSRMSMMSSRLQTDKTCPRTVLSLDRVQINTHVQVCVPTLLRTDARS